MRALPNDTIAVLMNDVLAVQLTDKIVSTCELDSLTDVVYLDVCLFTRYDVQCVPVKPAISAGMPAYMKAALQRKPMQSFFPTGLLEHDPASNVGLARLLVYAKQVAQNNPNRLFPMVVDLNLYQRSTKVILFWLHVSKNEI